MTYIHYTNFKKDIKTPEWYWYFYKTSVFYLIPRFYRTKLLWKDKYNSPRIEFLPRIIINWLWYELSGTCECEQYWEQRIWLYKYHNGDLIKAKKEWPWIDSETKESSWIDY